MDTNPHIPINEAPTNDGGDNGNDLLNCYFQELGKSNTFHFFDPRGGRIITHTEGVPSPVSNGRHFTFRYNELDWSVFLFAISKETLMAIGAWRSVPQPAPNDPAEWEDPESGTFQAQAGLGEGGELKAKALASS